jgi:hypothetical protein
MALGGYGSISSHHQIPERKGRIDDEGTKIYIRRTVDFRIYGKEVMVVIIN